MTQTYFFGLLILSCVGQVLERAYLISTPTYGYSGSGLRVELRNFRKSRKHHPATGSNGIPGSGRFAYRRSKSGSPEVVQRLRTGGKSKQLPDLGCNFLF